MNFLPGKGIENEVDLQIQARQKLFAAKDGFDRQNYIKYQQAVPWIKLSSGVRITANSDLATKYGAGSTLAERNVLFNFLKDGEDSLAGYENTQLGYRPRPGITGMQIHSHNRFGSLRTAVIRFQCWDVEQLNQLELLYMRPGYTLLLEWGHSVAIDNRGEVVTNLDTIPFFDLTPNSVGHGNTLTERITDYKKNKYHYNYDAIYGLIKNFNWSLRPDGGYDCSTSIVTTGDLVESYKANFYLSQKEVREDLEQAITDLNKGKAPDEQFVGLDVEYWTDRNQEFFGNNSPYRLQLAPVIAQMQALASEINSKLSAVVLDETYSQYQDQLRVVGPGTLYANSIVKSGQEIKPTTPAEFVELTALPVPMVKPRGTPEGLFTFCLPVFIKNKYTKAGDYFAPEDVVETKKIIEDLVQKSNGVFSLVSSPGVRLHKETPTSAFPQRFNQNGERFGNPYRFKFGRLTTTVYESYEVRHNFFVLTYNKVLGAGIVDQDQGVQDQVAAASNEDERYLSKLHYLLTVKLQMPYQIVYPGTQIQTGDKFNTAFSFKALSTIGTDWKELISVKSPVGIKETTKSNATLEKRYQELFGGILDLASSTKSGKRHLIYIKLGYLLGIINKHILKAGPGTTSENLFSFVDRGFGEEGKVTAKYFTFDEHISVNPEVCILPHTLTSLDINHDFRDNTILDILLNVDFILETLTASLAENGRIYLLDFFETLFDNIKQSCGGVNELQLQYDEDTRAFAVVDRRMLNKTTSPLPEISIYGLDSTVHSLNLVSRLTPKMSSMIAISAQDSPFNSNEESTGFAALNKGLEDVVYRDRVDEKSEKGQAASETATFLESLKDDITGVILVVESFYGKRVVLTELADATTGHYENFVKYRLGVVNKPSYNFIIPFELQLTLHGLSGIKVMEAFKVNKDLLPLTYGGRKNSTIAFLVTGVEHTVDRSGWKTTLRSQIFNTDEMIIGEGAAPAMTLLDGLILSGLTLTNVPLQNEESRIKQVAQYFKDKGLTQQGTAGLIGNLLAESRLNPGAAERDASIGGLGGWGIAQWTADRRRKLEAAASNNALKLVDMNFQLDYLYGELTTTYKSTLAVLTSTADIGIATITVLEKFEVPATYLNRDTDPAAYDSTKSRRISLSTSANKYVAEIYGGQTLSNAPAGTFTPVGVPGTGISVAPGIADTPTF